MWFLEHETLFGGKRVWLRPGSQQLFGRTRSVDKDGPQGRNWKIDNKAVSRKHVMLKVHEVAPEDGTKLHNRSQIEVTDLSCRQGTTIDEKTTLKSQKAEDGTMTYSSEILKGTEHTIRLAQGYAPFKIVWRPVVFTYASKESKDGKVRSTQLHSLDIKTTTEFIFDKTTHVVSTKRNLPRVLSGLTSGKHIVTAEFLEALLRVAASSIDEEQNYIPSQLEEDFDAYWPAEKDYIPAAGAEPVARPQEMLLPDLSRSEVFSGLTFVFLNEGQYSSLLDPITGGGGKALLYNVRPGETIVDEYVDYVHSVAGKKRRGKSGEKLPVITVRLPAYPDAMEQWAAGFVTGTDKALGQRSILQNEFLDVIITKDRTQLQLPPTEVIEVPSSAPEPEPEPEPAATRRSTRARTPMSRSGTPLQAPEESTAPAEEPIKVNTRKRIHRPKVSRFTGFDDDEPIPKKKLKVENPPAEDLQQVPASTLSVASSQTRADASVPNEVAPQSHTHDSIEKEEQMDTLFPTAAKMRKQRAATRAPSVPVEPEASGPAQKATTQAATLARLKAKAKDEKEINIREHTRQRIKEEEDRRKADEETLREALQGIDISELKNLAQVEEMEVLPRQNRGTTRSQNRGESERWNPEWNGRKNFKKFRRRGTEQGVQAHKVMVTLEEAPPKKGFGIGDAFFLEDVEPSPHPHNSRRGTQVDDDGSEPEVGGFSRRKDTSRSQSQPVIINVEDSGPDDEEVPGERTQRSSGRTQRIAETQLEGTQTQRSSRKRGSGAASGPPAKKGRFGRKEDDSDDEETGFRFKRRG